MNRALVYVVLPFTLVIGCLVGLVVAQRSVMEQKNVSPDPARAARWALLSILRKRDGSNEKAEFLEQVALKRLADNPGEIPEIWTVIRQETQEGDPGALVRVRQLREFSRAIDFSLIHCRYEQEFQNGWKIRQEVLRTLRLRREGLRCSASAFLGQLRDELHKSDTFRVAAETFRSNMNASHGDVASDEVSNAELLNEALQGADNGKARVSVRELKELLGDTLRVLVTAAERELESIAREKREQFKRDENSEGLEPSKDEIGGAYQRLIKRLTALAESLESIDLNRWMVVILDPKLIQRFYKLRGDVPAEVSTVMQLQRGRYNLWALRQIYAAQDSDSWPEYLGSVELVLLHPAASTLYSMVYDERLSAQENRNRRPALVKRVLRKPKVRPERF